MIPGWIDAAAARQGSLSRDALRRVQVESPAAYKVLSHDVPKLVADTRQLRVAIGELPEVLGLTERQLVLLNDHLQGVL